MQGKTEMAVDPEKFTVGKLVEEISGVEDVEKLKEILVAEEKGKNRKGAIKAIRGRIELIGREKGAELGGFDPNAHSIPEIGAAIKEIENVATLKTILDLEKTGENRANAVILIGSRIKKFSETSKEEKLDPRELSIAGMANAIRRIEDADELRALLAQEGLGENRVSVKKQIQNKIESIEGITIDEPVEYVPPEEKYPYLSHPTSDKKHVRSLKEGKYEDMWVYCETQQGELIDVSKEMLGKARELMDQYNGDYKTKEKVVAVLIGEDIARLAEECIAHGADIVIYAEDKRLNRFLHTPYTKIFCDMSRSRPAWKKYDEPRYVIFPATNNGRDLSAQVQAELDSGLASDCSGLYIEDIVISNPVKTGRPGTKKKFERVLHMKRPDFSGFEYSTILCLDNPHREFHPQGASVIPGSFPIKEPDSSREGKIVLHEMVIDEKWLDISILGSENVETGIDLSEYEVVVCMGRGIGKNPTGGIDLGLELVSMFDNAALGITRGIVTSSYTFEGRVEQYAKEERQIGETGQVIKPKLYIGAGVSGAIQHKIGMGESEIVIAINEDENASIRDFADYFINGDLFEVIPKMIEALSVGKGSLEKYIKGGKNNA